jgi:hypothetical protein
MKQQASFTDSKLYIKHYSYDALDSLEHTWKRLATSCSCFTLRAGTALGQQFMLVWPGKGG